MSCNKLVVVEVVQRVLKPSEKKKTKQLNN